MKNCGSRGPRCDRARFHGLSVRGRARRELSWWAVIRDLRTALERHRRPVEELKTLLGVPTRSGPSADVDPSPHGRAPRGASPLPQAPRRRGESQRRARRDPWLMYTIRLSNAPGTSRMRGNCSGSPLSLGASVPALGRFWYTAEPSTHDSSRTCRSREKACQVPLSCDENVLLDATRSGPSCQECLDPGMWDYWWALVDSNHGPRPYQGRALTT